MSLTPHPHLLSHTCKHFTPYLCLDLLLTIFQTLLGCPRSSIRFIYLDQLHCTARTGWGTAFLRGRRRRNFCWPPLARVSFSSTATASCVALKKKHCLDSQSSILLSHSVGLVGEKPRCYDACLTEPPRYSSRFWPTPQANLESQTHVRLACCC